MTKRLQELYDKAVKLENEKFMKFIFNWHGNEFLWDNFVRSHEDYLMNQGEKATIEAMESALEL